MLRKRVGATNRASGSSRLIDSNAASISLAVLALRTCIRTPIVRAAGSKSRNVTSVRLASAGLTSTATRQDDPSAREISRQLRQPIHLILCEAVEDRDVLALDEALLPEALAKCPQTTPPHRATWCRDSRSPASPAAVRARPMAMRPPRRRVTR